MLYELILNNEIEQRAKIIFLSVGVKGYLWNQLLYKTFFKCVVYVMRLVKGVKSLNIKIPNIKFL